MRMRLPSYSSLLLLAAAAAISLAQQQPASTVVHSSPQQQQPHQPQPIEADSCPPNTFTCRDGSCIPIDWVGDGEPDCDDHSDEDDHLTIPHPTGADANPTTVPQNSTEGRAEETTESMEDCPASHLERIDACSQPTFDLLSTLQGFDFNASSILPQSVETLKVGCDITREYDICVQGASGKCQPEPSIPAWRTSETFFCQLLIPSVNEHAKCFARERSSRCLININRATSTMCRLVGSIMTDMECLQKTQKGCSQDALAMLQPMEEEAAQTARDLNCPLPQLTVISEKEASFLEEEKRKENEKNKPEIEFDEDGEPIEEQTLGNTTSSFESTHSIENITDETEETTVEEEETETPTTKTASTVPHSSPSTTSTTTATKTQSIAPSTTVAPRSTGGYSGKGPTVSAVPVDAPRPPLGDAMRTMEVIGRVCTIPYTGSPWEDVHSLFCSFKEKIQKHTECFAKISAKAQCTPELSTNSSCSSMDAVNTFLDCAIVLMNDHCDVEAQNIVVDLQEKMNDKMIERRCFEEETEEEEEKKKEEEEKGGGFRLHPKLPSCNDDQENGALACLVELVQVNKELAQLQQKNFLLEISRENSTVVDSICGLYSRYEKCLSASVFSLKGGIRCSFSSPLNSLARIGLSPICSPSTRTLLSSHTDCLSRIAAQSTDNHCQSALASLGNTVQAMIQGAHGEALLCKSFYLIRQTFECGRAQVEQACDQNALMDLTQLKDEMTLLGEEEGCPTTPPANLDQLIAESFTRAPIVAPKISARPPPQVVKVSSPPPAFNVSGHNPQPVQPVLQPVCDQKQQQRFQECVSPLTSYQPHPLIVIRQPRLIDEACTKFKEFKECASTVACRPMWSRGMTAMFEYACEEALEEYKEIRGCIRKLAGEDTVRECVATFSRGAPQQACFSANSLLSCAVPSITTVCGEKAVDFTQKYITKFAQAIDSRCKLGADIPIGKVIGVGCSIEEDAVIEHCAAPLNDIGNRLDEMFQGGLQSLIKNANTLAPVFAGGCNLTAEFQACAAGILSSPSPCLVSSCMVRAGEEICSSPDPVAAIDANLSCVFSQVQEPSFAKCIRSTLSTIKQFSLTSFKAMLPKFVDCVEELVKVKCGDTPIKILRAISSREVCPMVSASKRIVPITSVQQATTPKKPSCDTEMKQKYRDCGKSFYSKYRMLPVSILNSGEHMEEFCSTLETMDSCSLSSRLCASQEELALKQLGVHLCSARKTFDDHKICLKKTAEKQEVASCLSEFLTSTAPSSRCTALQAASKCMAEQIRQSCGETTLQYAFEAMNVYASAAYDKCQISIPTVSLSTECSEADLIEFLTCESHIDVFSPRPIAVIANASSLSTFCEAIETAYRPCLEGMKCKFEPVSTANINLYTAICQEQVTRRDHSRFGQCLADYTNTKEGRGCIAPLTSLDLLNNENRAKVCSTVSSVLSCASSALEKSCGYESILHLYSLYSDFASHFDSHCAFEVPQETTTLAESSDKEAASEVEEKDEPVTTTTTTTQEPSTTTQEETTTTERSHARDFRTKASPSPSMVVPFLLLFITRFI